MLGKIIAILILLLLSLNTGDGVQASDSACASGSNLQEDCAPGSGYVSSECKSYADNMEGVVCAHCWVDSTNDYWQCGYTVNSGITSTHPVKVRVYNYVCYGYAAINGYRFTAYSALEDKEACPSTGNVYTQCGKSSSGCVQDYSNSTLVNITPGGGGCNNGTCEFTSYTCSSNNTSCGNGCGGTTCPSGQNCSNSTCVAAPTATATPTATPAPTSTGTPVPGNVNCWVCDQCKWRGPYQRNGTSCPSGEYISGGPSGATCSTGCTNPTGTTVPTGTIVPTGSTVPTTTASPTPSPTPIILTSEYRCSDIRFNKDDTSSPAPVWKKYENEDYSGEPIKFKYIFTNNVVQDKNLILFCQFKTDQGTTSQVYPKSIKYIGGDPKITNVSCGYDPSGTGTQVIVKGLNFGGHSDQLEGNMKIADKEGTISFWGEDTESSSSAVLKYKVIAKVRDKLSAGKIPITLTTDNGRSAKGYCNLGTTTIDFTVKSICGTNNQDLSRDNVSVDITEKVDKAKAIVKKKIKTDKEGKPQDFAPELEIGKTYILSIRGPKSIGKKVEFTAEEGTTTIDDIILPVGDIYPVNIPDNKINAFDKSQMSREWNLVTDIARPADLNNDLRVNSVDYSCLLINYNKNGD